MNIKKGTRKIGNLLKVISPAPRINILLSIGDGEACVCHLEAILGLRQAYISQHLMALRKARILVSRRDGRFIYYRLRDTQLLQLLQCAAQLSEIELTSTQFPDNCACPACTHSTALIPDETLEQG